MDADSAIFPTLQRSRNRFMKPVRTQICAASVPPVFPASTDSTDPWRILGRSCLCCFWHPRSRNCGIAPKNAPHAALERLTVPPSLRAHPLRHNLTVRGCTASTASFKCSRYDEAVPALERGMLTVVGRQASRGVFLRLTNLGIRNGSLVLRTRSRRCI